MESDVKQTVAKFFGAVNSRDFKAMGEMVTDDITWSEPLLRGHIGRGKEAYMKDATGMIRALPDGVFTPGHIFTDGDRAAFELALERTQSGAKVEYALFIETDGAGRIKTLKEYYDSPSLLKKLGLGGDEGEHEREE